MKFLCRILYRRYKSYFHEEIIKDFYSEIPESIKEPSVEFLSKAGNTLERFFSIQAYNIQMRSIGDTKNSQFYMGMLAHIKSLLFVIRKGTKVKNDWTPIDEGANKQPNIGGFLEGMKEYAKTGKKKGG